MPASPHHVRAADHHGRSLVAAREMKIRDAGGEGWSPRMRRQFGYFTPDEHYEAALLRLVDERTHWLDVGCGRTPFPSNEALGRHLAARCALLVGLDPSDNIHSNRVVHERFQCTLDQFSHERQFDVVSMRMVAEHIDDPKGAVGDLARLTRPGGRVVVYTVSRWSPASIIAHVTPIAFHHLAKRILWQTRPEDTFPTVYAMNTRRALSGIFTEAGFEEEQFSYLDDCRSLARFRIGTALELSTWRVLSSLGLGYPERCLLGVYRKMEQRPLPRDAFGHVNTNMAQRMEMASRRAHG